MARNNQQTISNEQIIAAMLQFGTQREAAAAIGIDERTIYNRMTDSDFKILYNSAKTDIIRTAVLSLSNKLSSAIDTINDIMQSKENNPAVRLQAAQTIINTASKFSDRLSSDEAVITKQVSNQQFATMMHR